MGRLSACKGPHMSPRCVSAGRSAPRWQDLSPSAPRIDDSCHLTCGRACGGGGAPRWRVVSLRGVYTDHSCHHQYGRAGGAAPRWQVVPPRSARSDESCHLELGSQRGERHCQRPSRAHTSPQHPLLHRRPLRRGHSPLRAPRHCRDGVRARIDGCRDVPPRFLRSSATSSPAIKPGLRASRRGDCARGTSKHRSEVFALHLRARRVRCRWAPSPSSATVESAAT